MQQRIDDYNIFLPSNLFYECLNCGFCCKNWSLELSIDDYRKLTENESYCELENLFPDNSPVCWSPAENKASLCKVDDSCIMLENNTCLIHKHLGYEAKPYVCRKFPFIFSGTPDGVYVGVSFKCKSIGENSGKPLEMYLSSVEELLREKPPDKVGKDIVNLTDKYIITWQSYCLLEKFIMKCLEVPDIFSASWIPLGMVTSLIYNCSGQNGIAPVLLELSNLPDFIDDMFQKRNEPMFHYQMDFAASIISIIEKWDDSPDMESSHVILNGGVFESGTYRKKLLIKSFGEYLNLSVDEYEKSGFRSYLQHIVKWRKQLLRFENLFVGLTALSFMPFLFVWYSFTSAISEGKEGPDNSSFRKSLGILDKYFHHWNQSGFLFNEFSMRILKEAEKRSIS